MNIKEDAIKQLEVNFLEVIDYPEWIANIILNPKKDGKTSVCRL